MCKPCEYTFLPQTYAVLGGGGIVAEPSSCLPWLFYISFSASLPPRDATQLSQNTCHCQEVCQVAMAWCLPTFPMCMCGIPAEVLNAGGRV